MNTELIATSASGLAWTVVYIALTYRGIKDRSYGMPLVPLALNFAWEVVFSVIYPPAATGIAGAVINGVWMLCDIGIIATYFKYSYAHFYERYGISRKSWLIFSILAFSVAFGIMLSGGPFFGQFEHYFMSDIFQGAIFIAYLQNLTMSVCFLLMIWDRKSSDGQSLTIAVFKFIGTGLTVGIYYLFTLHKGQAHLMNIIVGFTSVLDIVYIYSIFKLLKKEGRNPWLRL